ncbi:MAG: helix-hairpin-helix domain-containing protein [Bacteroidales bacterium]|nr:helix-hairpin-helix domain-containing protein [Bacteroidales bacterium]
MALRLRFSLATDSNARKKSISLLFFCFVFCFPSLTQEIDSLSDIISQPIVIEAYEQLLEQTNREGENEVEVENDFEKIDINKATYDDWVKLGLLTPSQITAILLHKQKHGNFLSLNELSAVDGMSGNIVKALIPFLKVGKPDLLIVAVPTTHEFITYSRYGFDSKNEELIGSKFKIRNNYRMESSQLSVRLLAEKDAGEPWFSNTIRTFDYLSSGVEYRPNSPFFKKVILGDYTCRFGQGLVLWNQQDIFQNIYTSNFCRVKSGIKLHSTFEENNFFRGSAFTGNTHGWEFSLWGSIKGRDATVSRTDSNGRVFSVSSFLFSGLHTSNGELANRHSIRETTFGSDIHKEWKYLVWGICGYHSIFSALYQPANQPYKSYSFSGNCLWAASSYARIHSRTAIYFTEIAVSNSLARYAWLAGITFMPIPELTINWLFRDYSPGYYSIYANAFSSGTQVSNEKGYCMGVNYGLTENHSLVVFFDFSEYPWLRYGEKAPTRINRLILQNIYTTDQLRFLARYKLSWGLGDVGVDENPISEKKHQVTLAFGKQVLENVRINNRIDFVAETLPQWSKGIAIAQDIDIDLTKSITLSGRYSHFNTDDWSSRIYSYEKNIWRVYSGVTYYGIGQRYAIILKCEILRKIKFWFRYSSTNYYTDGNNTFSTERDISEIAVQVFLKW